MTKHFIWIVFYRVRLKFRVGIIVKVRIWIMVKAKCC
jgi:hypothetical protein